VDPKLFRYIWHHSRRDQLLILSLILLSLPFYFASLDVPKRIVNDALQGRAFSGGQRTATLLRWEIAFPDWLGGKSVVLFPGLMLEQIPYLLVLSLVFLALVLINGGFKLLINIRRGVLGEKVLKQLRYDLFAQLLRLRPEDMRTVKPAEAASMIKDEIEPIGDFGGDAFITPVFLGTQALTALAFIVLQNAWLGAIALAVVLVQAVIIPNLRRRQLVLGRERQIAQRHLAGRIGAVVEAAPVIHVHGAAEFSKAGIEGQLVRLLGIRIALFKRKFAVKYLNNLLAQVTPFFFYSVGGYLALTGSLDLGQLVAVIAAYRDLPPPVKELIDWDQQRGDVLLKYGQVVNQLASSELLPLAEAGEQAPPPIGQAVDIVDLQVVDRHGETLLDTFSTTIAYPSHVALVSGQTGAGEVLARALGRQTTEIKGAIRIGGRNISEMPSETLSRLVSYASSDPGLLPDSIRDNVLLAVRQRTSPQGQPTAGNPTAPGAAWLDLAAAGAKSAAELDDRVISALEATGMLEELYKFGMFGRLGNLGDQNTQDRLVQARHQIHEELMSRKLLRLIEPFHPDRFNSNASIGENFLFGVPLDPAWSETGLAGNPYFRALLEKERLGDELVAVGLRVAETTMDMISGLPPGHTLLERYSLIPPQDFEQIQKRLEATKSGGGGQRVDGKSEATFIGLALKYVEARHRFQLVDHDLMTRIVTARQRMYRELPAGLETQIEFYDPERIIMAAPIRDNLLFGRMIFGLPSTEQQLWEVVRGVLTELDLERTICRIGLDFNVGPSGKLISAQRRAAINLARCLVKQPNILILDGALSAFSQSEAERIIGRIRERMDGKMLIATMPEASDLSSFDRVIRFEGNRVSGPKAAVQPA
jgi:putative ABC transport system ATP-binding protein